MSRSNPVSDWSDTLKAETRKALDEMWPLTSDGDLCLKHISSHFGIIRFHDLMRGAFLVVDRRSGAETSFASADDLIQAGWVVD